MIKKRSVPIVTITKVGKRWVYFQTFILGFYEMERQGRISLRFRCEWLYRLSTLFPENPYIGRLLGKLNSYLTVDLYNLEGFVNYDGKIKRFCIDSADAPYLFNSKHLDDMDVYFKMQCPREIDPINGFPLSSNIKIPYMDQNHKDSKIQKLTERAPRKELSNLESNIDKIKPLLNGFRQLSRLNSYKALKRGYDFYRKGAQAKSTKKLMCYFGNALGPKPEENVIEPDWDWEADIMGYYKGRVSHPNVKRGRAASIISSLGESYDARVISEVYADTKESIKHNELIVPIENFCSHISRFEYNLNISGYRMSIPSRFMESFIVGTAIITDKLALKWFRPFDDEVIETVEMGYLPEEEVNWDRFEKDINNLPTVNKERVLQLYEEKWAPIRIAEYIVDTILMQN